MAIKKTRGGKKVHAYTHKWKTIDDSKVRHVWSAGGREVTVHPSYYADCGNPVCGPDDLDRDGNSLDGEDMIFVRTEILA